MPTQQDIIAALTARLAQPQREQMPWERQTTTPIFDMFGSLQDDPVLRRARELQHDEAIADETYKAEYGEYPENFPPNVLAASVMANQGRRSAPSAGSGYVKSGSTILKPNPLTGELEEVWSGDQFDESDLRREKLKDLRTQRNALIRSRPHLDVGVREWKASIAEVEAAIKSLEGDVASSGQRQLFDRRASPQPANLSFIGEPEGWESPVSASRNWDRPTGVNYAYEEGRFGQPESPFDRGLKMGGGGSVTGPAAQKSGLKILNVTKRKR